MDTVLPERFAEEWMRYLEGEISFNRQQLDVANKMTAALTKNDIEVFNSLNAQLQGKTQESVQLQQRRFALRKTCADHLQVDFGSLNLEVVTERLPASMAKRFTDLRSQLRKVLQALGQVVDRNNMLIRSGLAVVGDCLAVLAGPTQGDGYNRRGSDNPRETLSGNLVNMSG